jgi:exodeoxyribonuclease VII small subunit
MQADEDSAPDGYGAALAELEDLLDELEGADIDVDRLADRVARGAELVRFCRARLDVVEQDVEAVVAELITLDGGAASESGSDSESGSNSGAESA